MLRLLSIFISLITLVWSVDRQTELEKGILCPCKKGVLYDHDSPAAKQLKVLLSELNKNPVDMKSFRALILTKFDGKSGDCLANSIQKNLSEDSLTKDQIHTIISDCYGEDLIMPSNKEGNSIILYIAVYYYTQKYYSILYITVNFFTLQYCTILPIIVY